MRKWRGARRECERDAAYWTGRAQSVDAPRVLRRAARAELRLDRHIAAGTKRLCRSRKRISQRAGPALIVLDGARLEGDSIVLPAARGEAPLRLSLAGTFIPADGWAGTGAVQVVDITDRKGRVTRRTRPGHRTYMARAILRAPAPQAVEPEDTGEGLGVVGGAVTVYDSSGGTHHMPDEAEATAAINDAGPGAAGRTPPHPPNSPPARQSAPSSLDRWILAKEMADTLDAIGHALDEERTVYLHCWRGDGRTGTVERTLCSRNNPNVFEPDDFYWEWAEARRSTTKVQLSALHGYQRTSGKRWFAWHGRGENQLHFTGERSWHPRIDDEHRLSFTIDWENRMSVAELISVVRSHNA